VAASPPQPGVVSYSRTDMVLACPAGQLEGTLFGQQGRDTSNNHTHPPGFLSAKPARLVIFFLPAVSPGNPVVRGLSVSSLLIQ
jgi:hypothetical protein